MTSYLFYLSKVQLAMQQLLSIFFRIFIDSIYVCLCVQNKWVFLVARTALKREFFYSLVSGAISPRPLVIKNEVFFTWIIVQVTKTTNNVKSRVPILATLGSVYSPCDAISVMLRIK